MMRTPKHGTRTEYVRHGCRCDQCREATRLYEKKRREERPDIRAQDLARSRKYEAAHPDRREKSKAEWVKKNPEKKRAGDKKRMERFRLKKYALTAEQHAVLLKRQEGVCAICSSPDNRQLSVDHVHETGSVRGLLCRRCNLGLGCFGDNADLLAKAILYLQASVENPTV